MPFSNYIKPFYDECLVRCKLIGSEDTTTMVLDVPFKVFSSAYTPNSAKVGDEVTAFVVYDIEDLERVNAFEGYLGIELPEGVEKFFQWTGEVVPEYQPWGHKDYPQDKKSEVIQRIAQIDTKIEDIRIEREINELLAKELGEVDEQRHL